MNFMICGGGTGGHVSPAISIYEELKSRAPDSGFCFIGRDGGTENAAYVATGERLRLLDMQGVNGKSPVSMLKGLFRAVTSLGQARKIIKSEKPDVIIGTGGYVCWPMLTVGKRMRIPTVIHESNAYPGLTTRLVAKGADLVLLNYSEAAKHLKGARIETVGNPLRHEFYSVKRRSARRQLGVRDGEFLILSFGGSLGAERLNEAALMLMRSHSSKTPGIKHIHATGRAYFERIDKKELRALNDCGCIIVPYIESMAEVMHAADLIISRCGAMTISEINEVGAASILIPSPNVADDHQRKNGSFMSEAGAAIMIEEAELTERRLTDAVRSLERDTLRREAMGMRAKSLSKENAAKVICDKILSLAK